MAYTPPTGIFQSRRKLGTCCAHMPAPLLSLVGQLTQVTRQVDITVTFTASRMHGYKERSARANCTCKPGASIKPSVVNNFCCHGAHIATALASGDFLHLTHSWRSIKMSAEKLPPYDSGTSLETCEKMLDKSLTKSAFRRMPLSFLYSETGTWRKYVAKLLQFWLRKRTLRGWCAHVSHVPCHVLMPPADPFLKYMIDAMEKAGCPLNRSFFRCEKCPPGCSGGFRPPDGVVICSNAVRLQEEVDTTLRHELIHAYDHCRAAQLQWSNCEHHACSEIRAANLSGDCSFFNELMRGNLGFFGHHQKCVRRRAQISVEMNPCCSKEAARAAVDAVYERCYKDTAPFDRVPGPDATKQLLPAHASLRLAEYDDNIDGNNNGACRAEHAH
eukprot:jgi/Mesvir1/16230/Mv08484-RA.1